MKDVLTILKALADEARLRALLSLEGGELCLCQIIELLGLSPSTVSKHMAVLHQAGLVERRKEGKWHYYRLAKAGEASPEALSALAWARSALRGQAMAQSDQQKLRSVRRKDLVELCACYRN